MDIQKEYNEIKEEIIAIRRKIHQNPELGFSEFETSKTIRECLDTHGIKYKYPIAKTGICAYVGNPKKDCNVLIRADMDALPFEENTGLEYSSKNKGVMHACGHDIHVANALAACLILKKYEDKLGGQVKFMFQPDEEVAGGALPMIEEGILENPHTDVAIGIHVSPSYETGELYFKSGPLMASPDDFFIKFIGKSAHGAEPQNGINPILPASEFVCAIRGELEKEIDFEKNTASICCINAGTSFNIIPDTATVEGTFRSFDNKDRDKAKEIFEKTAADIAKKHGAKCECSYNYCYPPLICDDIICSFAIECAQAEFGKKSVKLLDKPLMTGEDFAYLAQKVPSVFVWIGCKDKEHECCLHSSNFFANEAAIETGARMFVRFAAEYTKSEI